MCDQARSAGYAELPDGPRISLTHLDGRLTVTLSVPCGLLRDLISHGAAAAAGAQRARCGDEPDDPDVGLPAARR
jgi:hypothetical protein